MQGVGNPAAKRIDAVSWTLRILSGVSEKGCNSMVQGSRKFPDNSDGGG